MNIVCRRRERDRRAFPKIVVMGNSALVSTNRIELGNPAGDGIEIAIECLQGMVICPGDIAAAQGKKIIDGGVFHRQRAIHIGFADSQFRDEEQPPVEGPVMNTNGDAGTLLAGKNVEFPGAIDHPKGTMGD